MTKLPNPNLENFFEFKLQPGLHDNGDIEFFETRPFIAQIFLIEPEIKEKRQRAIKTEKPNKTLVLLIERARVFGCRQHKRTAETLAQY